MARAWRDAGGRVSIVPSEQREGRMIPRDRAPFSAIVDRPPLRLPDGARLVVWTIVNLEFCYIARPMARQVLPAPPAQVLLPNGPTCWCNEYGTRAWVWRSFQPFHHLASRP